MISIRHIARYWHTLRYLRPVQLFGRVWFRLLRPKIDLRPAPPCRVAGNNQWVLPARRPISLVDHDRFHFLNEVHGLSEHGWDGDNLEKLWRYNLHYFDDLNAQDAAARKDWHRALLLRWVQENPLATGTGWEPYPTSLRIVNWIKWSLAGNELPDECLESLAVQTRWLAKRLEIHLLGNHLFANAKALVFAGLFFDGREASGWLKKGMRILSREIAEQILADGGQFERSTMYHALALEDMLDLNNITTTFANALPPHWRTVIADWPRRINLMRDWLATMCHPDGEISLFNDAALGIAPTPSELERYARDLGMAESTRNLDGIVHLAQSGYIRVTQPEIVALLDVAPIGPDYLPGHAHADTLSFELSAFGERVLVNSGTSCYGLSDERLRQRETAAHNTVVVNEQSSSDVWAGFRVARRARPFGLEMMMHDELQIVFSHDGYRRMPGSPVHTRRWQFGAKSFLIEDHVSGSFNHAAARFHLHPAITVAVSGHGITGSLSLTNGRKLSWQVEMGELELKKSTYHPYFGSSQPSCCLVLHLHNGRSRIQFKWA